MPEAWTPTVVTDDDWRASWEAYQAAIEPWTNAFHLNATWPAA